MSETNPPTPYTFSESELDAALQIIDKTLPDFCDSLEETIDSPTHLVLVAAYVLTAVFATRPELYDDFFSLLTAFEPRYGKLLQTFAAAFPEAWAARQENEVFIVQPLLGFGRSASSVETATN